MDLLPRVLQNEIWEYVRGDRAYWKQQFTWHNRQLGGLFMLHCLDSGNWYNEDWVPAASLFKRTKGEDDVKFVWDPPVTQPTPSFIETVTGLVSRIAKSIFNLW